MVLPPGIEPGSTILQTVAMTTSAKAAILGVPYEYRPRATTFTELGASITLTTP